MSPESIAKIAAYAIVPGVMAGMGYHLATEAITDPRRRLTYKLGFWALFLVGVAASTVGETLATRSHNREVSRLNGDVGKLQKSVDAANLKLENKGISDAYSMGYLKAKIDSLFALLKQENPELAKFAAAITSTTKQLAAANEGETQPQLALGNLKARTIKLADDISGDLYSHGWPQRPDEPKFQGRILEEMPATMEGGVMWSRVRYEVFIFDSLQKVLDIRNEFIQLHMRDDELDECLDAISMVEGVNKQFRAAGKQGNHVPPMEILAISARLRVLAGQLK